MSSLKNLVYWQICVNKLGTSIKVQQITLLCLSPAFFLAVVHFKRRTSPYIVFIKRSDNSYDQTLPSLIPTQPSWYLAKIKCVELARLGLKNTRIGGSPVSQACTGQFSNKTRRLVGYFAKKIYHTHMSLLEADELQNHFVRSQDPHWAFMIKHFGNSF